MIWTLIFSFVFIVLLASVGLVVLMTALAIKRPDMAQLTRLLLAIKTITLWFAMVWQFILFVLLVIGLSAIGYIAYNLYFAAGYR